MRALEYNAHSQNHNLKHVQLPSKDENQYTLAYNVVPKFKQPDILNRGT